MASLTRGSLVCIGQRFVLTSHSTGFAFFDLGFQPSRVSCFVHDRVPPSPLECQIPKDFEVVKHLWPGLLTLSFLNTTGNLIIAVRTASYSATRALIAVGGVPLAASSANSSGRPSPTRAEYGRSMGCTRILAYGYCTLEASP